MIKRQTASLGIEKIIWLMPGGNKIVLSGIVVNVYEMQL